MRITGFTAGYPVVATAGGESDGEQFEGSVVCMTILVFLPHRDDLFDCVS